MLLMDVIQKKNIREMELFYLHSSILLTIRNGRYYYNYNYHVDQKHSFSALPELITVKLKGISLATELILIHILLNCQIII